METVQLVNQLKTALSRAGKTLKCARQGVLPGTGLGTCGLESLHYLHLDVKEVGLSLFSTTSRMQ